MLGTQRKRDVPERMTSDSFTSQHLGRVVVERLRVFETARPTHRLAVVDRNVAVKENPLRADRRSSLTRARVRLDGLKLLAAFGAVQKGNAVADLHPLRVLVAVAAVAPRAPMQAPRGP